MSRFLGSFKKAKHWSECYPLGNGNIGVMDNCDPVEDTICLNDDTFWSGTGAAKKPRYAKDSIANARKAYDSGNRAKTEEILEQEIAGAETESYIILGRLHTNKGKGRVSNYYRKLDFESGLMTVKYTKKGVDFTESSFVSFPDKIYARRVTASAPSKLSIYFESPVRHQARIEGNAIIVEGNAPSTVEHPAQRSKEPVKYFDDKLGMEFAAVCRVKTDGTLSDKKGVLYVDNYTYAEFYYTSKTRYNYEHGLLKYCNDILNEAIENSFELNKNISSSDTSRLFNKVRLVINDIEDSPEDIKKELQNIARGIDPLRAILTLYDFGRYLMIASSREGSISANLQGIWCNSLTPPWASNYTININFQMNYWATLSLGLTECYRPYVTQVQKIAKNGKDVASLSFNARGWCAGHNSDLYGHAIPVSGGIPKSVVYSICMGSAGWLCQGLYKKYKYTLDKKYLKKVLPTIEGAVEFYIDFLRFDEKTQKYVCYPDTSPENSYVIKGKRYSVDKAPAMTMCIIRELFNDYLEICRILEIDNELKKVVSRHMHFLTPYLISESGRIQEWSEDYKEAEPNHRHVSHLYGLYPGDEIVKAKGNALRNAARKSLEARGDAGTGWSMAWKTCLWARLKDGNRAYEILKRSLKVCNKLGGLTGGVYNSLLSAHPPFQIDGNFGIVAAINEMLVQSYDKLELLPALPDEWINGEMTGLSIEGAKTVNFSWKARSVIKQQVTNKKSQDKYFDIDYI